VRINFTLKIVLSSRREEEEGGGLRVLISIFKIFECLFP